MLTHPSFKNKTKQNKKIQIKNPQQYINFDASWYNLFSPYQWNGKNYILYLNLNLKQMCKLLEKLIFLFTYLLTLLCAVQNNIWKDNKWYCHIQFCSSLLLCKYVEIYLGHFFTDLHWLRILIFNEKPTETSSHEDYTNTEFLDFP